MTSSRQKAESSQQRSMLSAYCLLPTAYCVLPALAFALLLTNGCGYTTSTGLASHLKTVYIQPFTNKIDITELSTGQERYPLYRHQMELDITQAVISRYQFTGLLRPANADRADARLEGDLVGFRRDNLRYNASQEVEEVRLNVIVNLRFYDQTTNAPLWEESHFTGDTTYFALGENAETEATALDRAITDLAKRIVERSVENW